MRGDVGLPDEEEAEHGCGPEVLGGAVNEADGEGDGAPGVGLVGDDVSDDAVARGEAGDGQLREVGAGRVEGAEALRGNHACVEGRPGLGDDVV